MPKAFLFAAESLTVGALFSLLFFFPSPSHFSVPGKNPSTESEASSIRVVLVHFRAGAHIYTDASLKKRTKATTRNENKAAPSGPSTTKHRYRGSTILREICRERTRAWCRLGQIKRVRSDSTHAILIMSVAKNRERVER